MNLYTISYGKSKSKLKPIMTDKESAVNQYLISRTGSKSKEGRMGAGWFKVELAPKDAVAWRQKSATVGGNKGERVPIIRKGVTRINGWIGKNGFNPHT